LYEDGWAWLDEVRQAQVASRPIRARHCSSPVSPTDHLCHFRDLFATQIEALVKSKNQTIQQLFQTASSIEEFGSKSAQNVENGLKMQFLARLGSQTPSTDSASA
jgi:hypothetical protein